MLALCAHEGWSLQGYRDANHPVQRRILDAVADTCGLERDEILLGGDGCGVPAFAMPLRNLATGFARLVTGERLPAGLAEACGRIRRSMTDNPHLVAGTGRLDTSLMESTNLLVKGGAEGVFACGSPEGWGVALKVTDGASRAVRPAALSILARYGSLPSKETASELRDLHDLHGEVVGEVLSLL